jgi:hypothetical protein
VIDTVLRVNPDGTETPIARFPARVTHRLVWKRPALPAQAIFGQTEPVIPLSPESTGFEPVARQSFAGQIFLTGAEGSFTATSLTRNRTFRRTFSTHVDTPAFAEVGFETLGVFAPKP